MSFGLNAEGFTPKPLDTALTEQEETLKSDLGQSLNVTPSSLFGQVVGIYSELEADLWSLLAIVYASQNPDNAVKTQLDLICAINRITRKAATRTTIADAQVFGLDTTVIPATSQVSNTTTGDLYNLTSAVTLDKASAIRGAVEVNSVGTGNYTVTINSVNYTHNATGTPTIDSILTGVQNALNAGPATAERVENSIEFFMPATFSFDVSSNLTISRVYATAAFEADEAGVKVLPANNLTTIVTQVSGWEGVTNPNAGVTGKARETDAELRARRNVTSDDTLPGKLLALDTVTDVNVRQNRESTTDAEGTLPQHIWAIVEGGDADEIAQVIEAHIAAGIGTRGAQSGQATSAISGNQETFNYDLPTYIEPTIAVTYTIIDSTLFPTNGEDLIEQALIDFANKLTIGDALYWSNLFCPVNEVRGATYTIAVGTSTADGSPGVKDVPVAQNEKIRLLAANVTVSEAP